jgi:hypothetical protein
VIGNGMKFKGRKTKPIDVSQKREHEVPRRWPQQIAADKAKAKRARKTRAKQRRQR